MILNESGGGNAEVAEARVSSRYLVWGVSSIALFVVVGGFVYWYMQMQTSVSESTSATQTVGVVPLSAEAKGNLVTLWSGGELDTFIATSEEITKNQPGNIEARIALASGLTQKGSILFKEREYAEQAIVVLQEALLLDPTNSEAHRVLGYAYEIMQEYPKAEASYNEALRLNSNNAHAYSNRGHAFALQGNNQAARTDYTSALAIWPTFDHALFNLARLDMLDGDPESARIHLDTLLASSTDITWKASALQAYGAIEAYTGDLQKAVDYFTEALALDKTLPEAWAGIAEVKFAMLFDNYTEHLYFEVIEAAQEAIKLHPEQTNVYIILSDTLFAGEQYADSMDMLLLAKENVEKDISLSSTEKEEMRTRIASRITNLEEKIDK